MKKKILSLALAVALLAIAIVGGTMAYLTDTDDAVNTFTFGNVKIVQTEQQRAANGGIEPFADGKNVFPAVLSKLTKSAITVDGNTFQIRSLEGNYVDKIVGVTNTGSEEAFIRTIIAVPSMNGYDDSADASENPLHWNYLDASDFKGIGWDWNGDKDAEVTEQKCYAQDVVINGVKYDIYVATYNNAVASGAWTTPSMVGFYLDDSVDCDESGYFSYQNGQRIDLSEYMTIGKDGKCTLNILCLSQACQTAGFADAWEALDEAFGKVDKSNAEKWFATVLANNG